MAKSLNHKSYLSAAIACSAALSLASPSSLAADDLLSLSLEELLELKVTSSTLTDESLKTVPASITLFTRTQIQQLGITTLEELMNHVPGYQSYRSDLGVANYSSRSRRLSNNTCEVLVLMDGQRLEHDLLCGISLTDGDFSLNNIERIEFLRGPGSAIYGQNALFGVVNIITSKNKNNVLISSGNHQQKRAALNLSHQFNSGLHTSISAQSSTEDTGQSRLFDPYTQAFTDGHQQHNKSQSVYGYASWGDWSAQARHVSKQSEKGYSLGNLSDDTPTIDSYSNIFAINYIHSFNDQWKFDSRIYDTPYRASLHQRVGTAPLISSFVFAGRESGITNHLIWQEDDANALFGMDFSKYSIANAEIKSSTPNTSSTPIDPLDNSSRKMKAAYGQWQNTFNKHFSYILGIRRDNYSDTDDYTSPRLGLIFQCDNENTLKILYGEAFRVPSRVEFYLSNSDLQPEIAKTTEFIWMHTDQTYYLSVGLFDTLIKDPVTGGDSSKPTPYFNTQQQHLSGLEIESTWGLGDDWQLVSALSHIFNSPVAINGEAEDLISTSLIYSVQKITLSLSGNYRGKSRDSDNSALGYHPVGGVTLFDAHTHYQLTPEWRLYANIRNLSNKHYNQPAFENNSNVYGVPGTGREIEVGLSWNF